MRKLFDGGEINGEFFRDISRFVSLARLSCIVEDKSGANCVEIGQTACICTCANHRRISKEPLEKGSSILRCRHIIAVTFRTSSLPIPLSRDKKAHSERRTIVYYFFFSSTKMEYKNNRDSLSLSFFPEFAKSENRKKRGEKKRGIFELIRYVRYLLDDEHDFFPRNWYRMRGTRAGVHALAPDCTVRSCVRGW